MINYDSIASIATSYFVIYKQDHLWIDNINAAVINVRFKNKMVIIYAKLQLKQTNGLIKHV